MKKVIIIVLIIGIFSCDKKRKSESESNRLKTSENITDLSGFNLISHFEKNKSDFTADTIEVNDYSTDGGELIAYHTNEWDYLVLDFWIYGETGRLNYTYWTDNDLNFKMVRKLDFEYSKPYYEIDFDIDSTLYYISYMNSEVKLYDIHKKEIVKTEFIDSTKNDLEEFFLDVIKGVEIVK